MKYARSETGREIYAMDLCHGQIRSNLYTCLFCGKSVSYVTGSDRANPHFRHKNDESCIYTSFSKKELEEQAELRISNHKSSFHKWWQSAFHKNNIEVKMKHDEKQHIADIYLESNTCIKLKTDDHQELLSTSIQRLVIEIQYSNISASDAKNRDIFYNKHNQKLLWIVDISRYPHKIDKFKTLTQDKFRVIFPNKQHTGLSNIITNCKQSIILLDNGNYLFKLNRYIMDSGFASVSPLSRHGFLEQLSEQGFDINIASATKTNLIVSDSRNYSQYLTALETTRQVDVDEIINMIEDIPVPCLREGHATYASKAYDTYIDMVVSWLGNVSNGNVLVFKILQMWIAHIKKIYYSHDRLNFGKYKNVPINELPQSYLKWLLEKDFVFDKDEKLDLKLLELRRMDHWFVNNNFKNPGTMVYYRCCRDLYYRFNWDDRSYKNRKHILPSILCRPWIHQIPNVSPDHDGYVRSLEYNAFNLPNNDCDLEGSDDECMFMFKPIKIKHDYKSITKSDLLYWYGCIDEHFGFNYTRNLSIPKLQEYAFIDIIE